MKKLKLSVIIVVFCFISNFLFGYMHFIDLHYPKLQSSDLKNGKIFIRDVIDMRLKKGLKKEGQDFSFVGFIRNGYGVPFPLIGALPGYEIDVIVKQMITDSLKNAGYDAVVGKPDGSSPILDIGVLDFLSDGYSYGYGVNIQLRIMLYTPDGNLKLFETEISDNQKYAWSPDNLEDSFPAWTMTLTKVMMYSNIFFRSDLFSNAVKGKSNLVKNSMREKDKELIEIKVDGDSNLFFINLMNDSIEKISNLENFPNLRILNLENNKITKLENLDNAENIEALSFELNEIAKIENLDKLKKLRVLDLGSNQTITKIENLENLSSLEWLFLDDLDSISKIENLEKLTNLHGVVFNNCRNITKIENLESLKNLEFLFFATCQKLTAISGLEKASSLKELVLSKTGIKKIENLDALENLECLDISFNKISVLENLDKLKKLKKIIMQKTDIKILENLESLPNLKEVIIGRGLLPGNGFSTKTKSIKKSTYEFLKNNKVLIDGNLSIDDYVKVFKAKVVD